MFKRNIGNGSILVELHNELDLYNAPNFRKYMNDLFIQMKPKGIIISMEELEYIDSSGVGILLSIVKDCEARDCLMVICTLGPQVQEVIRMTQLDRLFTIRASQYEALSFMNEQLKTQEGLGEEGPIKVDERHDNFHRDGMNHKTINIDFSRIRYISHIIIQYAPECIKEYNLLEQQVSEIIKNAVRHGNRGDISKEVKIWWDFTEEEARLIVEDQGSGFSNFKHWNEFYRKRMECFYRGEHKEMMDYLSYRTRDSRPEDGGNALFAAMEYWNGGYIINKKGNAVALRRLF